MPRTLAILSVLVLAACSFEPETSDFGSQPQGGGGTGTGTGDGGWTDTGTDAPPGDGEDEGDAGTDGGSEPTTDGDGSVCGDGVVEGDEACDGADMAGQDCTSFGFDYGDAVCTASCTVDTSDCHNEGEPICGNGNLEEGEPCDGELMGGQDCTDYGFEYGTLTCSPTCNVQTTGCGSCGDGTKNGPEACDGQALGGQTCESQGYGPGTLACLDDCSDYDTTDCGPPPVCGDGIKNGSEECDTNDLGGTTCADLQGFDGGTLACAGSCTYDTSACNACIDIGGSCVTDDDCCSPYNCEAFFGNICI